MKYAILNADGVIAEIGVSVPVPSGAIEITDLKYEDVIRGGKWVVVGGDIQQVPLTTDQLLANAKTAKLQELETAFITASKLPVSVGTKTYNGGKESALAIRDYIQLVTDSGGTVYTIWDINNATANYTLAEAKAIMLAIATPVSQAEFNMNAKKNDVKVATTITAVNAVVW